MDIKDQWIEAVNNRTSRRTYIEKSLGQSHINELNKLIDKINEESSLNFQFLDDCSKLFKGFSASYGMIKGLNSCIAIVGDKNIENFKIKAGYYGEILVLEATNMELGTCWIGGTYDRKECERYIDINQNEELICVIAIGNVLEDKSMREKLISKMNKGKKSFSQVLLDKDCDSVPSWVEEGINFVLKSPSALNKQPFAYSFKNNEIRAFNISKKHGYEEIDLGISMLHFELGARKENYNGKWNYINGEKIFK